MAGIKSPSRWHRNPDISGGLVPTKIRSRHAARWKRINSVMRRFDGLCRQQRGESAVSTQRLSPNNVQDTVVGHDGEKRIPEDQWANWLFGPGSPSCANNARPMAPSVLRKHPAASGGDETETSGCNSMSSSVMRQDKSRAAWSWLRRGPKTLLDIM